MKSLKLQFSSVSTEVSGFESMFSIPSSTINLLKREDANWARGWRVRSSKEALRPIVGGDIFSSYRQRKHERVACAELREAVCTRFSVRAEGARAEKEDPDVADQVREHLEEGKGIAGLEVHWEEPDESFCFETEAELVLKAEELLLPLAGAEEGSFIVIPFKDQYQSASLVEKVGCYRLKIHLLNHNQSLKSQIQKLSGQLCFFVTHLRLPYQYHDLTE
ncbi:hypothetical protein Tco_0135308 [Tanacetum coccineum]